MKLKEITKIDKDHIWHPYSKRDSALPMYVVESAKDTRIYLKDGRELIDGMASWWSVIHGYNHPRLNQALSEQLDSMAHVMFGGLTHEAAAKLTKQLVAITPEHLNTIFYSDSGSVSVEVALKMSIQYWQSKGLPKKHRFCTIKKGYHGDTFAAMSVCDPQTGMHHLFSESLTQQFFVAAPESKLGEPCSEKDRLRIQQLLEQHGHNIAAIILEPIVQGAGGMRFYSADYLNALRTLCDEFNILLIFDEIATGFGRTGKLFALEHTSIVPDLLCIGKALTGGYLSLAATITTSEISQTIDHGEAGVFMHGPTFMANPLACAVSYESIQLLLEQDWKLKIKSIEQELIKGLEPCKTLTQVDDVRVLGAIGVVEMKIPVDINIVQQQFVEYGVWIRPFGKLIYLMPPFVITNEDCQTLCKAVVTICHSIK